MPDEMMIPVQHVLTDMEVVARVTAGEKELFELLMRRYNQRLYRTARAYSIPDSDCDDLIQQSYIKAYQSLSHFRGDAQFSTWITRILINECLMYKRKSKALTDVSDQEEWDSSLPGDLLTPERSMLREELRELLESAIEKLPEEYRMVYMMREVEELSVKETADCLSITEGNVKVRLHRARNLLRKQLEHYFSHEKGVFEFGSVRCDRLVARTMQMLMEDNY